MGSLPGAPELPPGFVALAGRRGLLVVREELARDLPAAGFGPDGGGAPPSAELSGRGAMGELLLGERRLVVRPFRHGGLLRWLTGRRYADPGRPFRELALCQALAREGLAVSDAVAARAVRAPFFGWHLDLVTERLERTGDLALRLEQARAGALAPARRARIARAVGQAVGRLHAAGVRHADLQPRNLLVADDEPPGADGPAVWVIDLEGSTRGSPSPALRRGNLARLWRAVRRREERGRAFLRSSDTSRFLVAYARALGQGRAERRADLEALRRADRSPGLAHRLGWWLERRFGNPERRDGGARIRG